MRKIKTIFERDWKGDRTVIDRFVEGFLIVSIQDAVATEKLDGTNVRATIRRGACVRLEKRRNPDKIQKAKGIEEPWYKDADEYSPEDKWLFDALKNTELSELPDGEWSGEAVGKNIQGNPLNLESNMIVFFTLGQAPVFEDVPTDYEGLKERYKLTRISNMYRRGYMGERKVKKDLEKDGWLVIRSAGSRSPFDLVAVKA